MGGRGKFLKIKMAINISPRVVRIDRTTLMILRRKRRNRRLATSDLANEHEQAYTFGDIAITGLGNASSYINRDQSPHDARIEQGADASMGGEYIISHPPPWKKAKKKETKNAND